jgi:hypothetical protein
MASDRCWGRNPDGPPAEATGNSRMTFERVARRSRGPASDGTLGQEGAGACTEVLKLYRMKRLHFLHDLWIKGGAYAIHKISFSALDNAPSSRSALSASRNCGSCKRAAFSK